MEPLNKEINNGRLRNNIRLELLSWLKVFSIVLCLMIFTQVFLFSNYTVYGRSMLPTIHDGDKVLVNKITYRNTLPDRFDTVVFHADEKSDYIKRIIGVPGDKIHMKNDILYINDKPTDEPYLNSFKEGNHVFPFTEDFTLEELTGSRVVPEGHFFVLGDNRRNSIDSRTIGFVSSENIVGKASLCYWPLKNFRLIK